LLLATPETLSQTALAEKLAAAADNKIVEDDMGPPHALAGFLAMDEAALRAYTGPGRLVTDNNAYFLPYSQETEQILQTMEAAVASRGS
jgi:hypothetical protein